MMETRDLDLLVAIDLSRDEVLLGHQRWLTGYIPIGGPAAVLLGRDGSIELVSERIGKPVTEYYQSHGFPIELTNGFSPSLLANRIANRRPERLGVAEAESFPFATASALRDCLPSLEMVDASQDIQSLRLKKSAYELAMIRNSCAIADTVWAQVADIFKVGRRNFEIIADVDHLVRLQGAEGGFHLVLPLPFLGRQMQSLANPDRIEANRRYLMEISPRYQGYYSQLTIPVSSVANDEAALRAYEDLVEAKRAAQPHMRPGADLSQVAGFIANFLAEKGRKMTSLSLGHFCGMALEEPRHDPAHPFILEEGMTLIFHPVLADAQFSSLMRADTYLVTGTGAERLNQYDGGMLVIA